MNNIKKEFTIKDLENISGIKAHTIRIWEKRYNLLEPNRSETNIRSYNPESLQKLLNIVLLNKNNFKVSRIAKMSNEEIDRQKGTLINDLKDRFRYRSIEDEGNDPAEEDDPTDVEESLEALKNELKDKGGRPREGNTYKKDKHPYGRDPLGDDERTKARKRDTREGRISVEKAKQMVNGVSSKRKYLHENDMLNEDNLLDDTKI